MNIKPAIIQLLINLDHAFDYIPGLSTITNTVDLIQKRILKDKQIDSLSAKNHYYQHITDKATWRCVVLLVPVIGNLIVALYEIGKRINVLDWLLDSSDDLGYVEEGGRVNIVSRGEERGSKRKGKEPVDDNRITILKEAVRLECELGREEGPEAAIEWLEEASDRLGKEAEDFKTFGKIALANEKYLTMANVEFELGNLYKQQGDKTKARTHYCVTVTTLEAILPKKIEGHELSKDERLSEEKKLTYFCMMLMDAMLEAAHLFQQEGRTREAIIWYEKAAEAGYQNPCILLINQHENSTNKIEEDEEEADHSIHYYIQAAAIKQNQKKAIEEIGEFAKQNKEVFVPYIKAIITQIEKMKYPSSSLTKIKTFLKNYAV